MSESIESVTAEQPPGRCVGCGGVVDLAETFERERSGKTFRAHRRSTRKGHVLGAEVCGPVVQGLVFHVYAKVQEEGKPERTIRTFLSGTFAPEDDLALLDDWERHLEAELAPRDGEGKPIEGSARVTVVVERWSLAGTR